ncbi:hypothetical protein CRE_13072 [Caenorhabditis remanei]|uniref:Uncharacterized protein n=1 Tax=Caenorhabditis remanei TaxID=31234 RepID=E3N7G3_CAERE|nr:hypothetical protein CRE_13072 [Caenorhabditis remanei]
MEDSFSLSVSSSDDDLFFFISSGGKVKLSTTNSKVQFRIQVSWSSYPSTIQTFNVSSSDYQPTAYSTSQNPVVQVKADTRVSATVATPFSPRHSLQYLRGLIFFDGSTTNSTSLGTGLQLLNAKSQYVSTEQYMTVVQLEGYDGLHCFLQDYDNTKEIVQFQSVVYTDQPNGLSFTLDGTNGPSALQSCTNYSEILIGMNGNGLLHAYLGGVRRDKKNMVRTYSANNSLTNLPQEFQSDVRTYVSTGGKSFINISDNWSQLQGTTSIGRKGFFISPNYGVLSNDQSFEAQIKMPSGGTAFRLNPLSPSFVGKEFVKITLWDGSRVDSQKTFSAENQFGEGVLEVFGDRIDVLYSQDTQIPTTGFYMIFEVVSSCYRYSILISVVLILLNLL